MGKKEILPECRIFTESDCSGKRHWKLFCSLYFTRRNNFNQAFQNQIRKHIKTQPVCNSYSNIIVLKDDIKMETVMENRITYLENPGNPSVGEQLFEVLTFCFLIVPGLAFSFVAGSSMKENFLLGVSGVMLSDLALVTLVCFFLWHNGEKFSKIGWVSKGYAIEIIIGVLLYFSSNSYDNSCSCFRRNHIQRLFDS